MFGSKKISDNSDNHTLISKGTKVVGDIHFVGELQVEGQVIGNVIAEGSEGACLVIHEKGIVEGEVRVPSAVINGDVRGDLRSTQHLELASNAVIQGNVFYNIIEMVKGSQVNGSLVHFDDKADNTSKKDQADSPLKKKVETIPLGKNTTQSAASS